MKKFVVALLAVTALVPAVAAAQDRGWDGRQREGRQRQEDGRREQPAGRGRGAIANPPAAQPQARPQARPQAQAPQRAPDGPRAQGRDQGRRDQGRRDDARGEGDRRGDFRGGQDRRGDGRGFDGRQPQGRSFDGRSFDGRQSQGRGFDGRDFDRRGDDARRFGRGGGGRFNYRGRSFDRFRAQPYNWPGGYRNYAWRPRQILPRSFLLQDYFIYNYQDFGFGPPPYGFEWVRVGDDALLVNRFTGEILDVVPGVFYW